jgi:hypothetical protein
MSKALRNKFCFGKALSSQETSTTRETQKRQLNSLYNDFGSYMTSFIVISVIFQVSNVFFVKKLAIFVKRLVIIAKNSLFLTTCELYNQ